MPLLFGAALPRGRPVAGAGGRAAPLAPGGQLRPGGAGRLPPRDAGARSTSVLGLASAPGAGLGWPCGVGWAAPRSRRRGGGRLAWAATARDGPADGGLHRRDVAAWTLGWSAATGSCRSRLPASASGVSLSGHGACGAVRAACGSSRTMTTAVTPALTIDDPAYFDRLAEVEAAHWWSLGMWRLASHWLDAALGVGAVSAASTSAAAPG